MQEFISNLIDIIAMKRESIKRSQRRDAYLVDQFLNEIQKKHRKNSVLV